MELEALLKKMVAIPSISKNEQNLSTFLREYMMDNGVRSEMCGDNVICSVGSGKKTLLFNSHLDTVPACSGWKTDPFKPVKKDGRIIGLGANDAKASMTAMADAVIRLADSKTLDGRLFFAATVQEETLNVGIQQVMERLGKVDAVVIGEPTGLDICTSMRGLVILRLKSTGRSAHASRPSEGVNAIYRTMSDIERLKRIKFPKKHPVLGCPSIATTMINGGVKSNVIPSECEFTVDVRTTPFYGNMDIIEIIKRSVESKVDVVSSRLIPKETGSGEKIVRAAKKANPGGRGE
jgi:acetylornithine deacetylase